MSENGVVLDDVFNSRSFQLKMTFLLWIYYCVYGKKIGVLELKTCASSVKKLVLRMFLFSFAIQN